MIVDPADCSLLDFCQRCFDSVFLDAVCLTSAFESSQLECQWEID